MDPRPVVDALGSHRADFVLVGSGARYLLGEDIVPADVDVVVSDSPVNRLAVVDALIELDGYLITEGRLERLTHATVLPWEWSWNTLTAYGPVDMIVQFIDGTRYEEHNRAATSTPLGDGRFVRCRATRHEQ